MEMPFFLFFSATNIISGKINLINSQLKQSWMVRNKDKNTQNTFTSSIPNPAPHPLEQGWGMGAVVSPQQFLSATPPSSGFSLAPGFSMGSAGEPGSPPALPLGLSGLFLTFFLPIPAVAQLCPALGQLDPAVSSKGNSGCHSLGTCTPADRPNWLHNQGSQGCKFSGKAGQHSQL